MAIEEQTVKIEKLEGHGCFACGTANPIGLNMEFYRNENVICSEITLGKQYEGWESMVHGGIVSTLLDEVMSWTVMYFKKSFLVTRKMNIKYIKPVPSETPLIVSGKLGKKVKDPKIQVSGQIRNRAGEPSRTEFRRIRHGSRRKTLHRVRSIKRRHAQAFPRFLVKIPANAAKKQPQRLRGHGETYFSGKGWKKHQANVPYSNFVARIEP